MPPRRGCRELCAFAAPDPKDLHLDLGSVSTSYAFVQPLVMPVIFNNTSTVRDDAMRAGLNYRIGP